MTLRDDALNSIRNHGKLAVVSKVLLQPAKIWPLHTPLVLLNHVKKSKKIKTCPLNIPKLRQHGRYSQRR